MMIEVRGPLAESRSLRSYNDEWKCNRVVEPMTMWRTNVYIKTKALLLLHGRRRMR
jgi:hypothetical protein